MKLNPSTTLVRVHEMNSTTDHFGRRIVGMKLDLHSVPYALGITLVVSPVPPEHIRHPEVLRPDSAVGFQRAKRSGRRLLHAINSNAVIEII